MRFTWVALSARAVTQLCSQLMVDLSLSAFLDGDFDGEGKIIHNLCIVPVCIILIICCLEVRWASYALYK